MKWIFGLMLTCLMTASPEIVTISANTNQSNDSSFRSGKIACAVIVSLIVGAIIGAIVCEKGIQVLEKEIEGLKKELKNAKK